MRGAGDVGVVRSIHNYVLFIILCFINSMVLGLSNITTDKSSQPCGIVQKLKPILADDPTAAMEVASAQPRIPSFGHECWSVGVLTKQPEH